MTTTVMIVNSVFRAFDTEHYPLTMRDTLINTPKFPKSDDS